ISSPCSVPGWSVSPPTASRSFCAGCTAGASATGSARSTPNAPPAATGSGRPRPASPAATALPDSEPPRPDRLRLTAIEHTGHPTDPTDPTDPTGREPPGTQLAPRRHPTAQLSAPAPDQNAGIRASWVADLR